MASEAHESSWKVREAHEAAPTDIESRESLSAINEAQRPRADTFEWSKGLERHTSVDKYRQLAMFCKVSESDTEQIELCHQAPKSARQSDFELRGPRVHWPTFKRNWVHSAWENCTGNSMYKC